MNKTLQIIGIIILVAVLGASGWFLVAKQSQKKMEVKNESQQEEKRVVKDDSQEQGEDKVESQKSVELKIEDVDTSNWKKYCNEEHGFCLKYSPKQYKVIDNNLPDHQLVYIKNTNIKKGNDTYGLHITVGKLALTKKDFMAQVQAEVQNAPKGDLAVTRILKNEEMNIDNQNIQKLIATFPIGYEPVIYFFKHNSENFMIKCVELADINSAEILCDEIISTLHFSK